MKLQPTPIDLRKLLAWFFLDCVCIHTVYISLLVCDIFMHMGHNVNLSRWDVKSMRLI